MKRVLLLVLFALGLLVPAAVAAKLRVVTTHADLGALTRAVGGDRVDVVNIVEPTQDPHFVDARPSLMLELNRADLLVMVGLELEVGWLPALLTGARNAMILPGRDGYLDTSSVVDRKEVPFGPVDRSMGDIHPGGNPHFTREPHAGLRIAAGIAQRLSRLDPDGASAYRRNYAALEQRLTTAITAWEKRMEEFRGSRVVVYHSSWVYFVEWLGLEVAATIEPKPGIPPDPAHVADVLRAIRSGNVRAILQEEYYPDSTSRLLADKSGAKLVSMPGGTHLDDEDYIGFVDRQVRAVEAALRTGKEGTP